jgi:hypothetical protein
MWIVKGLCFLILLSMLNLAFRDGPVDGVLTFLVIVGVWKWRYIFEFIQDRRWRENWRDW